MTNLLIRLFVKDYQDVENHTVRERYGKFAGIVGIATNILLFCIKIFAGIVFHSVAQMNVRGPWSVNLRRVQKILSGIGQVRGVKRTPDALVLH